MVAGGVAGIVILALGAAALGAPDALRLLIAIAGRNPAVDIGICLFLFTILTVQLLGTVLLVRFVRKAAPPAAGRAGGGAGRGAPRAQAASDDPFARVTLVMSLAAAFLVAVCLVAVSGDTGSAVSRPLVDFAAEYFYPTFVISAAAAAATTLLRAFREQRNARGRAAPAERAATAHRRARSIGLPLAAAAAVCALVVATPSGGARGGLDLDALRLRTSTGFTNMPDAVAVVAGAALLLLVRFYRRARNAAAGGGAAPAPAAAAPRRRGASTR